MRGTTPLASTAPLLAAREIQLRRGGKTLAASLSIEVPRGSVVALVARGGEGTTTLLKVCAGLLPPDAGTVEVDGVDLHQAPYAVRRSAQRRVGFVFQERAMISNVSLFDNVALPLRYHRSAPGKEIRERVQSILEALGLAWCAEFPPAELGRAEFQAGALARALLATPEILVCDDIFARLSRDHASRLWQVIRARLGDRPTMLVGSTDRMGLPMETSRSFRLRQGRLFEDDGEEGARSA